MEDVILTKVTLAVPFKAIRRALLATTSHVAMASVWAAQRALERAQREREHPTSGDRHDRGVR